MKTPEMQMQAAFALYAQGKISDEEYDERIHKIAEKRDRQRIREARKSKRIMERGNEE